ncbi:MAG: phosphotransferase [Candidatus Thorarchaeota archaeon]|jgi:thiamine kinase-like enzyme
MKETRIITDAEELTPEWLTDIFRNNGLLSQGKVAEIVNRTSLRGSTYSLELKFSDDTQRDQLSSSIVVKPILSDDWFLKTREAKFYSSVPKIASGMPIPSCFDSAYSEKTGNSHIILDNFSETHAQYSGHPPSKQFFQTAIDSLAEIHASWWNHKELGELSNHSFNYYPMQLFKEEENLKWVSEQKRFLEFLNGKISEERRELLETVFSSFPAVAFERFKKGNLTLVHNDAHTFNFYFPKDNPSPNSKALLFDWECWGTGIGCQDLVYMIGFWEYPDYRRLIEKDLVKHYHDVLSRYGITDYSWEECWYDYRLCALLNVFRIVWWSMLPWIKPSQWWRGLERSLFTIHDLGSMELLE